MFLAAVEAENIRVYVFEMKWRTKSWEDLLSALNSDLQLGRTMAADFASARLVIMGVSRTELERRRLLAVLPRTSEPRRGGEGLYWTRKIQPT